MPFDEFVVIFLKNKKTKKKIEIVIIKIRRYPYQQTKIVLLNHVYIYI